MNNSFKKIVRYALILGGYSAIVNLIKEGVVKTVKESTARVYRDF